MNHSIESFSKSDRVKAESLLARVDNLLDKTRQTQEQLYRNFVEVGIALNEVKGSRAWMLRGHSFDAYLMSCQDRFGRKRTSLYSYTAIAETLSGSIPHKQLIGMGISKCQSLAQYVKKAGKQPTPEMILAASDPKIGVDEFQAKVYSEMSDAPEKGKWFDFGGAYLTPDEKAEILRGFDVAANTDPAIPQNIPDWSRTKQIMQRFVQEFIATYEPVLQGEGQ